MTGQTGSDCFCNGLFLVLVDALVSRSSSIDQGHNSTPAPPSSAVKLVSMWRGKREERREQRAHKHRRVVACCRQQSASSPRKLLQTPTRQPQSTPTAKLHLQNVTIIHECAGQRGRTWHISAAADTRNGGNVASAANNTSLGVGYSGSGFLIFYFVGEQQITACWLLCRLARTSHPPHHRHVYVQASPQSCSTISDTTRLAGSSGCAAVPAASCSGLQPRQQYEFLLQMANTCRPSGGCRHFLGSVVSQQLHSVLLPDAPQAC